MKFATAALAALAALAAVRPAHADEPPRIDPDRDVYCFRDKDNVPWRVQCNPASGSTPAQCIVAVDGEVDEDGKLARGLERARSCIPVARVEQAAGGISDYKIVRGTADAPRGWMRDDRGRVFQVTFDLRRRLYAGVAWTPTLRDGAGGDGDLSRTAFDVGLFEFEGQTGDAKSGYRHRLRVAEGIVQLAPFGADATLFHYDVSRRRADPLFRITTFFGAPRRYDIDAHIGGWLEVGHLTISEVAPDRRETLWRAATAHLTWDVWRTPDMESFVRLRTGLGWERALEDGRPDRSAITSTGAAEGDLTIGDSGFNRLTMLAQLERPNYVDRAPGQPQSARRALGKIGYERILVAINDQPLTLRVSGEAEYRSDVPDVPSGWDMRALVGVRFNLWAPPR